jgi:hypothetical protein
VIKVKRAQSVPSPAPVTLACAASSGASVRSLWRQHLIRTGARLAPNTMRSEQRWPDYAQHAAAHGVLSSLSVPLPFQGATIGD